MGPRRIKMINDSIRQKLDQVNALICDGKEETIDVEFIGFHIVNGDLCIAVLSPEDKSRWEQSPFPPEYMSVYQLKRDEPEMAGGLLSEGPEFPLFDPQDEEWEMFGLENAFDDALVLQRDSSGSPYFFRKSDKSVYCINLDCKLQRIGPFEAFMVYCLDQIIEGKNWYSSLHDEAIVAKYGLVAASAID
jgi:hypothetical protein